MIKRIWQFLALLWLLIVTCPTSCLAAEEIIIGVATSLTSLEGIESFKAVELAVDEVNAKGGVKVGKKLVPIRIESIDLRGTSPEGHVSDALLGLEKIIVEKKVHAIVVGPFRSEVLLAGMDIIAKYKVPMLGAIAMSPASDAKIMKDSKYKYIFRICLNSKYLVDYLINTMKFLNEKFGFNKVYIMNQDVAWARTTTSLMIKLFFDKAGWEILGMDNYPYGASDFSASLMKADAKGAQVLLPIFDMPESGILVKQWNLMQVPSILCGFISPMMGPSAWQTFDGKIGGALIAIFELGNVPSVKYAPSRAFYKAYKAKYGKEIEAGHGPAPAYESVYILVDAIEKADSLDPDMIVLALEETDRIGVMGRIRFHKGHQVLFGKDPTEEALACIIQWTKDGKRKIVYPPSIAEREIKLPAFIR